MTARLLNRVLMIGIPAAAAIALLVASPAHAGYGYGGGGGGKKKTYPSVRVKVKNGDLILSGPTGAVQVEIEPELDGLRVRGLGDTYINGSDDEFLARDVTGAWKLKFQRSRDVTLTVERGADGVPRPAPTAVTFVGGARGTCVLEGVDIEGDLRINLKRSRLGATADATAIECTVGGDLRFVSASRRAALRVTDSTVVGLTRLLVRDPARTKRDSANLHLLRSQTADVAIKAIFCNSKLDMMESTVNGNVRLDGDVDLVATDSSVHGDLTLKANSDGQTISLGHVVIDGVALFTTGASNDHVSLVDCSVGMLDLRTGGGNDTLFSDALNVGAGSSYSGAGGRRDAWHTADDTEMLTTTGVEDIGPAPVDY